MFDSAFAGLQNGMQTSQVSADLHEFYQDIDI